MGDLGEFFYLAYKIFFIFTSRHFFLFGKRKKRLAKKEKLSPQKSHHATWCGRVARIPARPPTFTFSSGIFLVTVAFIKWHFQLAK